MQILIAHLVRDKALYPRNDTDWVTVNKYAEAMAVIAKDPKLKPFPPIEIVALGDGTFGVIDGWHRCAAAEQCKLTEIEAVVVELSPQERFLAAVERNLTHGRPFNAHEKAQIAQRLCSKDFGWSLGRTAKFLCMAKGSLQRMMLKRVPRDSRGGFTFNVPALKGPLTHLTEKGRPVPTPDVTDVQRPLAVQNQVHLFVQVQTLLDSGTVNLGDPKVRKALREIASWCRKHSAELQEVN